MRKNNLVKLVAILTGSLVLSACGKAPEEGTPETFVNKGPSIVANNNNVTERVVDEPAEDVIPEYMLAYMELQPDLSLVEESSAEAALAFVKDMRIGWNLGNALDAINDSKISTGPGLEYEMIWCGVYTEKEDIQFVKELGFNTIRIPVSWHNHIDKDYKIATEWLDRVQEVVDYAYDEGLYVIIDLHHDVNEKFYYPSSDKYDSSAKYMEYIWSQLADRFKDYDNHLIFEAINEPRLVGKKHEWYIEAGNAECVDAVDNINKLNQVFIDTVRRSGGNNINRYVMIPGYDSSLWGAIDSGFKMPEDVASHKMILTTHAYTPYDFALQLDGKSNFTYAGKNEIDYLMKTANEKFIQNGIPVIMGEFGAINKDNLADRVAFTEYYMQKATENDVICIWWDNNAFDSGETFGLFRRNSRELVFPEIIDAMMNNVPEKEVEE